MRFCCSGSDIRATEHSRNLLRSAGFSGSGGLMHLEDASLLQLDRVDLTFELFDPSFLENSIIDRFDEVVRRFPSRVAVQDAEASVTYAELAALVDRIAAATIAATDGREGPIALLLPPGVTLPAAMLGVLAAGRAYVALDADFPGERNKVIISDAAACAIISSRDIIEEARAYLPAELPIIDIHDVATSTQPKPGSRPRPDDLAAIYYTSGSSGRPKGVAWNHRNVLHWVRVFTHAAEISSADRIALLFSASVTASYRSIYSALLNGARSIFCRRSASGWLYFRNKSVPAGSRSFIRFRRCSAVSPRASTPVSVWTVFGSPAFMVIASCGTTLMRATEVFPVRCASIRP